jgi:precorrin-3B synthase
MESGDGLIVRVRPRAARLEAHRLAGLAQLAGSCGNGIIELTRRANLQVRGVTRGSLPRLQAALVELGLAESQPEQEKRPALLVCPFSGLDERCPALESLADELESVLSLSVLGRPFAEKLGLVLGGGASACDDVLADLRIRLHPAHPGFADLLLAGTQASARALGSCRIADVAEAVAALLRALATAGLERPRMRDVLLAQGPALFESAVQHLLAGPARSEPSWSVSGRGFHAGARNWFGFELPFGSAEAETWLELSRMADQFGTGEIRFTPARQVLLPGVRETDRAEISARARERGWGVERNEPFLELIACSGAPACRSAQGDTRGLAREIADWLSPWLAERATLHVSGCPKGCASAAPAEITLVRDARGCRLGFGLDVVQTSLQPVLSADAVRAQLRARYASSPGAAVPSRRPTPGLARRLLS